MNKFNTIVFANTLAIVDLVLHPLFHLWVAFFPRSYEWFMNLFVAGLKLDVTGFDSNILHVLLGTALEASLFWILGYAIASLYNKLSQK